VAIAAFLALPRGQAAEPSDQDAIALARSVIKADRQAIVTRTMQLTDTEAQGFWPLYQQYRADMDKVGDGMVKLVQDYAAVYPNVPEDRARTMLKDLLALEKDKVSTRATYLNKFAKVLPAEKNLRFAQVENRLDLATQLKLASSVPLVPIEGRLTTETSGAAVVAEGVPGGAIVETRELTATVAAINRASRKVTLVDAGGIKTTVKVGPEAINFDQIRLGDQLQVTATEEMVVQMAQPGDSAADGTTAVVALAPKGAKPGGVVAETTEVIATVTAIDQDKRTATLTFDDGSTKTLPVRTDVDLSKRKVGEKVVFRVTETVAIRVAKQ
jgi:hypothetical protein